MAEQYQQYIKSNFLFSFSAQIKLVRFSTALVNLLSLLLEEVDAKFTKLHANFFFSLSTSLAFFDRIVAYMSFEHKITATVSVMIDAKLRYVGYIAHKCICTFQFLYKVFYIRKWVGLVLFEKLFVLTFEWLPPLMLYCFHNVETSVFRLKST